MYLYHGSRFLQKKLSRKQAYAPAGRPSQEGLNAIYLSPDFAFALVSGARPEGVTKVDHNNRTVHFENQEKFDPNMDVYIYVVDSSQIPDDKIIHVVINGKIDNSQIAVDLDEIEPLKVERHKAGEVFQHYKII